MFTTFCFYDYTSVTTMSLEEKKIEDKTVDRLMDEFTSNLDMDGDLLAKCLSKELITANDICRIGATLRRGMTREAAMDLMLHVKRSCPGYLKTFCAILEDSKSRFLASYIEEEYRVQSETKEKLVSRAFSPPSDATHCSPLRTSVMSSLDISKDDSDDVSMEMGNRWSPRMRGAAQAACQSLWE